MTYDYDALYRDTPHALGDANPDVVNFFERLSIPVSVLDIGCGQGRDAVMIARLGHNVTAVDFAPAGIDQLAEQATMEALGITAVCADVRDFEPSEDFDVLLIDRTLHMLDVDDAHAVLGRLLERTKPHGHVFLLDEKSRMPGYLNILENHGSFEKLFSKSGVFFARLQFKI